MGAPIVGEMALLDDAEKEHYLNRHGRRFPQSLKQQANWPNRIPEVGFQFPSRTTTRDGMLVVRRQATTTIPDGLYDVIDRSGRLVRQLQVLPNQQILGFGKGTVYLVTEDDYGLKFLSRHRW